jgi:type I restriction enzyme S subunit
MSGRASIPALGQLPTIPSGWRWAPVKSLGVTGGQTVLTGPFGTDLGRSDFVPGGVPLLTISCLSDRGIDLGKALHVSPAKALTLERYRLRAGDILFSRMASVGRAAVVPAALDGALFNYHLMRLRLDHGQILPSCFRYYVQGAKVVRDYLRAANHGATRDGINSSQLLEMPVVVPPRDLQERIVEEIEQQLTRLDAGVAALKRVQANLKRYRAAVLKAACEGRLVPTEAELARQEGRPCEPASNSLERSQSENQGRAGTQSQRRRQRQGLSVTIPASSPPLPEGWAWARPGDVASQDRYSTAIGPFGSNLKVSDYAQTGVPLVFVRNIRSGTFGGPKAVFVSARKAEELAPHAVSAGDVLITKMGDPPGDACLYPEAAPDAIITADCIKLRVTPEAANRRYIVHALNSQFVRAQILAITKGVAQLKISLGRFTSIVLPLPPLAEQHRIVAEVDRRLSLADDLAALASANAHRAVRLRQAVLCQAFSIGTLRQWTPAVRCKLPLVADHPVRPLPEPPEE